jgi:uncharacterized membrane protein
MRCAQTILQLCQDCPHAGGIAETRMGRCAKPSVPKFIDLTLAFDEIRQFGASSVQVMRRMRAALDGLTGWLPLEDRRQAVRRYLERLDRAIETSAFDADDQRMALEDDRQGIGLSRRKADMN